MKSKDMLGQYLLLWGTQALSTLGSGMTSYALVLYLYLQSGSALKTALLSVCSYAPYVAVSMFAGALSDRWNKKRTMLLCDLFAALGTVAVLVLFRSGRLCAWHLYVVNALSGLMNTVQQPASEVAATLLVPTEYYQKTSGLRSFSSSFASILTPVVATALFTLAGMEAVIAVDLLTFSVAFVSLLAFIRIPEPEPSRRAGRDEKEPLLASVKGGLLWLKDNPLVMDLILFLACINLVASMYDAALPALILPHPHGGEKVLGMVNVCVGLASLAGSVLATFAPAPKNRVRAICAALFVSLGTENFLLAFGRSPIAWCVGAVLGWLFIPLMNANMDVILRTAIPRGMQGRIWSCRNALQFFTIPIGLFLGGFLTDSVFEPFMELHGAGGPFRALFGSGKGSGAALLFCVIGILGVAVCTAFSVILRKHRWRDTDGHLSRLTD